MITSTELNRMSVVELSRLNKMVVSAIKQKQQMDNRTAIYNFMPGDNVKFTSNRNGSVYTGKVLEVKRTKVVVQTGVGNYLVPASMLRSGE